MTGPAGHAHTTDDGEDQVLGRHARGEPAVDVDRESLRLALQQALGGKHMPDLGRTDAEGEGAEGAVGAGVTVPADDGLAGLGHAELGPDDVDDATAVALQVQQLHAELGGIVLELLDLLAGRLEPDRQAAEDLRGIGRRRVVQRRQRPVQPANLQPALAQHRKGLGGSDLVREVQVYVEHRRRIRGLGQHLVFPPEFLEHRLRRHVSPSLHPMAFRPRPGRRAPLRGRRCHCVPSAVRARPG